MKKTRKKLSAKPTPVAAEPRRSTSHYAMDVDDGVDVQEFDPGKTTYRTSCEDSLNVGGRERARCERDWPHDGEHKSGGYAWHTTVTRMPSLIETKPGTDRSQDRIRISAQHLLEGANMTQKEILGDLLAGADNVSLDVYIKALLNDENDVFSSVLVKKTLSAATRASIRDLRRRHVALQKLIRPVIPKSGSIRARTRKKR